MTDAFTTPEALAAMREAYAEAQAEREPTEVTNIRCRALATAADRLMAGELKRC